MRNIAGIILGAGFLSALMATARAETISYAYDPLGRLVASVADRGPTATATTMYRYDVANNRSHVGVAKADGTQIPVFRFVQNSRHFYTAYYLEGRNSGMLPEGNGFSLYPGGGSGLRALYRCYQSTNDDHFVSTLSNCEGQNHEGLMGYAYTTAGTGRRALYRFYKAGIMDHLITTDYSEATAANYTLEATLGYVI